MTASYIERGMSLSTKHFPVKLKQARGALTQKQLADKAKVSQPVICHSEKGNRQGITLETFVRIANALGSSADALLKK